MTNDLVIETTEVVYRGQTFAVHGLTLDLIMRLINEGHRSELEQAVDTLRDALGDDLQNEQSAEDMMGALATVVVELPLLAAKVIAGSADQAHNVDAFQKLPISVTLDALHKIGKLTFDGEDSVKKFVGQLIEILISVRKAALPAVQAAREQLAGMKA